MNTGFYLVAFKQWEVVYLVVKYLLNFSMLSPSPRDGVASTVGFLLVFLELLLSASMGLISGLLS